MKISIGEEITINSYEGLYGRAKVIGHRDSPGICHQVQMLDPKANAGKPFWAFNSEIAELQFVDTTLTYWFYECLEK
jgi:hypothetical protein